MTLLVSLARPMAAQQPFSRNRASGLRPVFALFMAVQCPALGLASHPAVPFAVNKCRFWRERGLLTETAMML
jgi:hypothetical protein